jgi:hypothetical protein
MFQTKEVDIDRREHMGVCTSAGENKRSSGNTRNQEVSVRKIETLPSELVVQLKQRNFQDPNLKKEVHELMLAG